ncbi:MAG: hypothetical protein NXI24_04300 [bacterium]|nr:hypothetical protein [bacterium]
MAAGIAVLFVSACETTPDLESRIRQFNLAQVDKLTEDRNLHADHYPASNERRIDLFRSHIADLKGGYIGVGTDQNLTFVAWAKSDFAWLIDFDYVSVDVNRIHLFFISRAATVQDFRKLWDRKNRKSSFALLEQRFASEPDFYRIRNAFKVAHRGWNDVPERLKELDYMVRKFKLETFVNNPADYAYIRKMVLENRIQAIPGDLKGPTTLLAIGEAARRMEMPIRVVYTSNAEEYMRFPEQMRKNLLGLPVDDKGLIIRTTTTGTKNELGFPDGEKYPDTFPFHYNIQPLPVFQAWLARGENFRLLDMIRHSRKIEKGMSIMEKTPQALAQSGG